MSSEYTPTIQGVRDGYVWLVAEDIPVARDLAGEEFDRFLARVRRDAEAAVLREAAEYMNDDQDAQYLVDCARDIEETDR